MRLVVMILLLGLPLAAQMTVVGESAAGGAPPDATYWLGSANGSLSAEIVVNDIESLEAAISAYDFNDAANLTTGDIAAARMATNWGTAGTSACATSGGVMFDTGSTVGCDSEVVFDGSTFLLGPALNSGTPVLGMRQDVSSFTAMQVESSGSLRATLAIANTPIFTLRQSTGHTWAVNGAATYSSSANAHKFVIGTVSMMEVGGDQTALIQDQTATTGDTLLKVLSGAGESGNCQEWDDDGTGALASVDCETGNSVFSNVTIGTTGATFYGPSASEPIDCTTANDGSMYFDTDDQKLCICANDGTDDEWLHSDNYGHLTGHCSI